MAQHDAAWPAGLAVAQVRFARPTNRLAEVVKFYSGCLRLPEIGRFTGHDGFDGVMLGLPGKDYHLEFTTHVRGGTLPVPSADNLLVLYFTGPDAMAEAVERLEGAGHRPVPLENPYWAARGAVAFADPDGWPVVLMPRTIL